MNTVLFLGAFARLVFPHLQAYDPHHFRQNSVVVLDNARIHVAAMPMLRLLCALKGAKLISLPPVRLRTDFLGVQRITLTVFVVAVLAGPEPGVCCTARGLNIACFPMICPSPNDHRRDEVWGGLVLNAMLCRLSCCSTRCGN
jgi:hypothetical protein